MLLTIDFESYYDQDCTLKKLNYVQYLNHPKFEVLGMAVIADQIHDYIVPDAIPDFLDDLNPDTTDVLAHNVLFDGAILSWKYGFKPRKWLDTLSMSRGKLALPSHSLDAVARHFGLEPKLAASFKGKTWSELTFEEQRALREYARHDVWLCREIYERLLPYPDDEMGLIDLTARMFLEPVLQLDVPLATELLEIEKTEKLTLREKTGLTDTQLSSNKQLAELIVDRFDLTPPTKISLRTGKETFAFGKTDPEFLEFYESVEDIPELHDILKARLAIKSTIEETRLEALLETQKLIGAIPAQLIYFGAHTGRWGSSGGLNLLNLPKTRLRNTLVAPPDHVLLIADSAGIEARVLAWFAKQEDLLEDFRNKIDIYKKMASAIYNTPVSEITKDQRNVGKQACLGCGYSMGATKFRATAAKANAILTDEEAQRIVGIYRQVNDKIKQLWHFLDAKLTTIAKGPTDNGFFVTHEKYRGTEFLKNAILMPDGLTLKYPNLHQDELGEWRYSNNKKMWMGLLTENIVQRLARTIIGEQALRADRDVAPVKLLVHDEIVCVAPIAQAEKLMEQLLDIMRTSPIWAPDMPLDAEGSISAFYKK